MCNDFGNEIPYAVFVETFDRMDMAVAFTPARPNLQPRDEIWPSENAPVIRAAEKGGEFLPLRWGLGDKIGAKPVINMRAEHKTFERNRCLIPASHYYEFTGNTSPKKRWKVTRTGAPWFCFAGIAGFAVTKAGTITAFSMLTIAPGPDSAPYHDREPVIVEPADWMPWLRGAPAAAVLRSSQPGSLHVEASVRPPAGGLTDLL